MGYHRCYQFIQRYQYRPTINTMTPSERFQKLLKWFQRAEEATTREEAQKAIKKAEKHRRKLDSNEV